MAGLLDDVHLATMPVLMGHGENLFHGLDLPSVGYEVAGRVPGERAVHVTVRKRA
jgi:hypothetical protein